MNWFREHRLFTVIAGIVFVLCLVIVVSFLSAGGSSFIGRGTHKVVNLVEKPLSYITSGVRNTVAGVFRYNDVLTENEKLKERIAELENENIQLSLNKEELEQLQRLSKSFDFKPFKKNGDAVAANVTEIDYSNPYVVFTVDAGLKKGVKKNSIVVDGEGLIGRVIDAGDNYSKVVSILSDNNNVSFAVQKNLKIRGVISANSKGELEGYVLNKGSRIIKGETLVTSGIGVYPSGIKIGRVSSVDYDEDRQLKVVTVKPTVNFDALQKVAIYK